MEAAVAEAVRPSRRRAGERLPLDRGLVGQELFVLRQRVVGRRQQTQEVDADEDEVDDGRAEVDGRFGGSWRVPDQDGAALDNVDDGDDEEHLRVGAAEKKQLSKT